MTAKKNKLERILIIEDEADTRKMLSLGLRSYGYEVSTAASGARAREILESEDFRVVVADLRLPDVTGLELTLRPSIPLSPDFELYGRAGWGWYDAQASFAGFDVDGQEDEFVWGFGGAWTPERSPFSLFIEYTQPDFDVDTSFVTLGVTLSL